MQLINIQPKINLKNDNFLLERSYERDLGGNYQTKDSNLNSQSKNIYQHNKSFFTLHCQNKIQLYFQMKGSERQVTYESYYLKNGIIFCIRNKQSKLIVCRMINNYINTRLSDRYFKVNLLTGKISLKMKSGFKYERVKSSEIIQHDINTMKQTMFEYYSRFTALIQLDKSNKIDHIITRTKYQKYSQRFIKLQKKFKLLTELQEASTEQYSTVEDALQKSLPQTLTKNKCIYDRLTELKKMLVFPIAKVSNTEQDHTYIYDQIQFSKPQKIVWRQQAKGGSTLIKRANVNFRYISTKSNMAAKNLECPFLERTMVRKECSDSTISSIKNKITDEKVILEKLTKTSNVNIPKYYFIAQETDKLYLDYYANKSIDNYMKLNSSTYSLSSKLHMLGHLIQGLRFLKSKQIVHLDIKPSNAVLAKSLITKIIDFGQADIMKTTSPKDTKGYSIPYCSVDIFNKAQLTEKTDVSNLGAMMCQLIFSDHAISIRNMSTQSLIKEYRYSSEPDSKFNYRHSKSQYNLMRFGPPELMCILGNLCLRCLNLNQVDRPYLDWILLIIRESISYIELL